MQGVIRDLLTVVACLAAAGNFNKYLKTKRTTDLFFAVLSIVIIIKLI
jgi:hypothetical protein